MKVQWLFNIQVIKRFGFQLQTYQTHQVTYSTQIAGLLGMR